LADRYTFNFLVVGGEDREQSQLEVIAMHRMNEGMVALQFRGGAQFGNLESGNT
jgi:hypothetical protein